MYPDFYCFLCGHRLNEIGLGFYQYGGCKHEFLPFIDKSGNQAFACMKPEVGQWQQI